MSRLALALGLVLSSAAHLAAQEFRTCKVDHTPPTEADKALAQREFVKAAQGYAAILTEKPDDLAAIAGLVRAELAEGRLDDALALVRKQLAQHPADALLKGLQGEVSLRRGEPEEAVRAFNESLRADPCIGRLHFNIWRYQNLAGMAATARKQLELAHKLSPADPTIDRAWQAATAPPLSPQQVRAHLADRVNAPDASPEEKAGAAEALRGLDARQRGDCEPVDQITSTTLKIVPIANGPSRPFEAAALDVLLNGKRKRLEIDTGATGLLISRGSAISAGLIPEAEIKTSGIGDNGTTRTFVTHVDDLRIGAMHFKNCIVGVFEKRSVLEVDGLIGADVFRNYLVTLDTPSLEVRLAPLPKPPDQTSAAEGLATSGEEGSAEPATQARALPHDRYIAPEMQDWTRIYRIGHTLIVPTRIGNAPTKLFIMDTGASIPLISTQAAREVTHLDTNDRLHVKGISGEVKNVQEADTITLEFAGVRQLAHGMTSIDTSNISRSLGVEIAGFLSFPTLRDLILTVDYRDNLLHVVYDPKHGFHAH